VAGFAIASTHNSGLTIIKFFTKYLQKNY